MSESFSLEALFLTAEEYGVAVYAKTDSHVYISFADISFREENKTNEVLNRISGLYVSLPDIGEAPQTIKKLINRGSIRFEYGLFSESLPGKLYYYKTYIDPDKIDCYNYLQSLAVQLFLDSV